MFAGHTLRPRPCWMKNAVLNGAPTPSINAIASPWHTFAVLAAIFAQSIRAYLRADAMRSDLHLDRIKLYERTILVEWLMFGLVLVGLWLYGSSPLAVVGERWRSLKDFLRDMGIGFLFLITTIAITSLFGHDKPADRAISFLLPQSKTEIALWILVSLSAGICEEAVYRGYLQKQFAAFTRSVPIGIVVSALLFASAHSYQGLKRATSIALLGIMAGVLAHWRGTTRPGMSAHALQDTLGGLIRR